MFNQSRNLSAIFPLLISISVTVAIPQKKWFKMIAVHRSRYYICRRYLENCKRYKKIGYRYLKIVWDHRMRSKIKRITVIQAVVLLWTTNKLSYKLAVFPQRRFVMQNKIIPINEQDIANFNLSYNFEYVSNQWKERGSLNQHFKKGKICICLTINSPNKSRKSIIRMGAVMIRKGYK